MQPFTATVKLLAETFSWRCTPNTHPNPKTKKNRKYRIPQADINAALAAEGFKARYSRTLPNRHAFVRAVRLWLTTHAGASHSHTTAKVIDSLIATSAAALKFQIHDKMEIGGGITFRHAVDIIMDRKTGTVSATDAAVEQQIHALLPGAQAQRTAADVNNLIRRLAEGEIGFIGLIPWEGRGSFVVLEHHLHTLDRICAMLARIGVKVTRSQVWDAQPYTPPGGTAPPPNVPNTNAQQVGDALADRIYGHLHEVEAGMTQLNTETNQKRRDRLIEATNEALTDALAFIGQHAAFLNNRVTEMSDHAAYVRSLLERRRAGLPEVMPFTLPQETTTYIADTEDGDDGISLIEVVSAGLTITGQDDDPPPPKMLPREGKIHWNAVRIGHDQEEADMNAPTDDDDILPSGESVRIAWSKRGYGCNSLFS